MIITIASFKGGVGKTTTALHLAQYLGKRRGSGKVVLLDGDPNRSALSWYERGQQKAGFSVLDGDEKPSAFNHLVIDTPARTDPTELLPLAAASDLLIIPSEISIFSLEATIATVGVLQSLSDDRYRILLTMLPTRGIKRETGARDALREAKLMVFDTGIKDRAVYQDAALEGLPVGELKGSAAATAWNDYQALGKEIWKDWGTK
ncbi:MAG: ParA family protein [Drouetiella hepatica Uher 2000/2452]|jgi:chromosome partitioning protein|uniref:ParA family protein n=1 Tax=Drouetiella hepatica Uher 2000/2452 TaxID=904376 RepID=A0A951US97_9CYAN|nr:ParA family protein [Drouetiella hepatica Uher 2000/2452]